MRSSQTVPHDIGNGSGRLLPRGDVRKVRIFSVSQCDGDMRVQNSCLETDLRGYWGALKHDEGILYTNAVPTSLPVT